MNDKGSTLVVVVFTMLIVLFLGTGLLEISTMDFMMSNNQVDAIKAYYIAEAGMNKAIAALRHDQVTQSTILGLKESNLPYTLPLGEDFGATENHEGNFSIMVTKLGLDPGNKWRKLILSSTGKYDKAKRVILSEVQMNIGGGVSPFLSSGVAVISDGKVTTNNECKITGNVYAKGNIDIGSSKARINGSVFGYGDSTRIGSNDRITGDLMSSGTVNLDSPTFIDGDLLGSVKVSINSYSHIGGDVQSQNIDDSGSDCIVEGNLYGIQNVKTGSNWNVSKDLFSSGTVTTGSSSTIQGNLYGKRDISLGSGTHIGGNIQGKQLVTLNSNAYTDKNLYGQSNVTLESSAKVTGDLLSSGNVTLKSSAKVIQNLYSSQNIFLESSAKANGGIQGEGTVSLGSSAGTEGSIFARGGISIGSSGSVLGDMVSYGDIELKSSNATVHGDVFGLGSNKSIYVRSDGIVKGTTVSHGSLSSEWHATFGNDVYGKTVSLGGGNAVSGNIHYVQPPCSYPRDFPANKIKQIEESEFPQAPDFPSFPSFPGFPEPSALFNILTTPPFPGIPQVTPEQYQEESTKITQENINLSNLSSGVYYVDNSVSNVNVSGAYTGVITIVSKGKITVTGNITTEDHQANGLMLLSFKEIYFNWNITAGDALFFCVPYNGSNGQITTSSSCKLQGGVIAGNFTLGSSSELICDDSISQKFGIGSSGISSVVVNHWSESTN
ncbi:hypothetical protein [Candidatus Formimonas warabiya]|uniref:Polymer-forming cytoskeletal protein n=1 Tax=Formimonas warabiya TaxID=1761012 RepID=A0A3G1KNG6_FORW1|nr:hypothetical protein [Candidatus Formimonas warabiya]ATW23997.1 hypothetical protein DCMF_03605 [Candidatus Formimonas warabiya]